MDCKFVIDTFMKCGGKMYCNYENSQCIVLNTNLKCTIQTEEDKYNLDRFLWSQMYKNTVQVIDKDTKEINCIHRFQDLNAKAIIIDTLISTNY